MTVEEKYMLRCIELSKIGLRNAMPNPCVGAVIVYNNKIIGEGYTSAYGGNHAEVNAIKSVKNEQLLPESTLYVSLEPCCHYGKTPPCSSLIIEKKIKKVVIGCLDPNTAVNGKGVKMLQAAGIEVVVGVLEQECKTSHKKFFTYNSYKRPYIILKYAKSADGFIAPATKNKVAPFWLSDIYQQQLSHKWRTEEQAILVGTNTVVSDNPSLTVRKWHGKNPVRIYLDRHHRVDESYAITNLESKTICITEKMPVNPIRNVIYECINFSHSVAKQIAEVLYKHQIQSVIIEGGTKILQTFIDEKLYDETRIISTKKILGTGVKEPFI